MNHDLHSFVALGALILGLVEFKELTFSNVQEHQALVISHKEVG